MIRVLLQLFIANSCLLLGDFQNDAVAGCQNQNDELKDAKTLGTRSDK